MDSPATIQDVAVRWRSLSTDEEAKAQVLLDDAWLLIKLRNSTIETRLSATPATLDVGLVVMVQCAMAIRVLRNPDGKRQEQIEDYSYQRDDSPSGELFLSPDELELLAEVTSASVAYTIRPYVAPSTFDTNPLDVWFS